jgi:hypothetical protein
MLQVLYSDSLRLPPANVLELVPQVPQGRDFRLLYLCFPSRSKRDIAVWNNWCIAFFMGCPAHNGLARALRLVSLLSTPIASIYAKQY